MHRAPYTHDQPQRGWDPSQVPMPSRRPPPQPQQDASAYYERQETLGRRSQHTRSRVYDSSYPPTTYDQPLFGEAPPGRTTHRQREPQEWPQDVSAYYEHPGPRGQRAQQTRSRLYEASYAQTPNTSDQPLFGTSPPRWPPPGGRVPQQNQPDASAYYERQEPLGRDTQPTRSAPYASSYQTQKTYRPPVFGAPPPNWPMPRQRVPQEQETAPAPHRPTSQWLQGEQRYQTQQVPPAPPRPRTAPEAAEGARELYFPESWETRPSTSTPAMLLYEERVRRMPRGKTQPPDITPFVLPSGPHERWLPKGYEQRRNKRG